MSLDEIRAAQHNDLRLASDAALTAFLAEVDLDDILSDLTPHSAIERRHLASLQGAA